MTTKRGDDAKDHAPRTEAPAAHEQARDRQDGKNYENRDKDALKVEDVNSANDDGAS